MTRLLPATRLYRFVTWLIVTAMALSFVSPGMARPAQQDRVTTVMIAGVAIVVCQSDTSDTGLAFHTHCDACVLAPAAGSPPLPVVLTAAFERYVESPAQIVVAVAPRRPDTVKALPRGPPASAG